MDICSCCTFFITFLGFSVFCLAKNVNEYSGQLGETLTIVCPYQRRADRWARKLWCKENEVGLCQAVVSAHQYSLYGTKTRGSTTISDNAHEGMVTVNITNLQKDDAGLYECRTVIFGDTGILQKIRVLVLEEDAEGNVSAVDKVQYSISGSQSDSQMMVFILGSSLLLCKVLVMGLLYSWWKIQHTKKVKHESFPFLSAEQALHTGDRYEEPFDLNNSEGNSDPYYINYVYRGHLDQEH
ncbi:PREDICTED: triggering receptor expressed on myeloid cells 2-like [Nanorana parkeri]|uniref:triggering receptor expressed on myeloid cells 2-like n=1 Tax=Nanorana parkeri TaxID=125878 RepID=UPI0008545FC3|nr:PREDICTED: triggering receptor expressed on myeloid cells 2-like [Nanorana parkeri]